MAERKLSSTNFQNQSFLEERCSLNELINLLSKRWMTEVMFSVEEGVSHFNGLKESLQHISDHILADRLKHLESNGLILKSYIPGNPPGTEYTLTDKGAELSILLDGLCKFAEEKM